MCLTEKKEKQNKMKKTTTTKLMKIMLFSPPATDSMSLFVSP